MHANSGHGRLSQINTRWSMVLRAKQGPGAAVSSAQEQLLEQYGGAVYHYLLGMVHDANAAEDLSQEFALRFLRGAFRHVTPERGRFRDFLKAALRHLVVDHYRDQQILPRALPIGDWEAAACGDRDAGPDASFLAVWRDELLAQAWAKLAAAKGQAEGDYYDVLRLRAERPELRSAQLAEQLSVRWGRALTAAAARQMLHRARAKFASFLMAEVARSLGGASADELEEELAELGLLPYCQPAMERSPGR
jgi:RNA polymerase sigma-70 factor (ECF subfamily)